MYLAGLKLHVQFNSVLLFVVYGEVLLASKNLGTK